MSDRILRGLEKVSDEYELWLMGSAFVLLILIAGIGEGLKSGFAVFVFEASFVGMVISYLISDRYLERKVISRDKPGSFIDKLSKDGETYYIISNLSLFKYYAFKVLPFVAIIVSIYAPLWAVYYASSGHSGFTLVELFYLMFMMVHMILAFILILLYGEVLEDDLHLLDIYSEWDETDVSTISIIYSVYYKVLGVLACVFVLGVFISYGINFEWYLPTFALISFISIVVILLSARFSLDFVSRNIISYKEKPDQYLDEIEKEEDTFYVLTESISWSRYISSQIISITVMVLSTAFVLLALYYIETYLSITPGTTLLYMILGTLPFIAMFAFLLIFGSKLRKDFELLKTHEEWSKN